MIRVGLTGNIGSGKSVVAGIFSSLEVPVFHADDESKGFLKDTVVAGRIAELFGSGVCPGGLVDNRALAARVFGDQDALGQLNSLLHPLVMKAFDGFCRLHKESPYVIMEAAILLESGYGPEFRSIIHVSCPEALAVERVMKRDGATEEQVRSRMRHQFGDAEKAAKADFIILNDGSMQLIPQVLGIHRQLLSLAASANG